MARRLRFKKKINIGRVVAKVATTVLVLYVGGTILNEVGETLQNTASPFYQGFSLIGWTVATVTNATSHSSCAQDDGGGNTIANCLTLADGTSSGLLAVVGIIGLASIVMEFVEFRMG